ncbi:hypothetical protein P0D75_11370 [Paraburkholderia sediminicola]|uniref:hypothetical protein n=1 Tax=Paraburkholderia sediminicola TaxID=458836 RepID=UPI0038B874F6
MGAPRSDLAHFLRRPELAKPGVYILSGVDPADGEPIAYVGEAEVVSERIKQHKNKDYWNSVIAFISKDENLTRAHIRYLEGRLIKLAESIGRYKIANTNPSGARLPESDQHDMEVYLERIAQLLPVLGSELLSPIAPSTKGAPHAAMLYCRMKGATARGLRSPNGFVVLKGSTAVAEAREDYYDILERTQKGTLDITEWLAWFLDALHRAIDHAQLTLNVVLSKASFWRYWASTPFNERQIKLLNRLLDGFDGKLTSSKWAAIAKCSPDTALRDISELVASGVLKKSAAGGRSTSYELAD